MYQNGMNNGFGQNWNNPQYSGSPQHYQNNYPFQAAPPSYYQQVPLMKTNRTIPGRIVSTVEEITPNDVPMDGAMYPFVMQDYSCVVGKRWNSKGQIETVVFVPKISEVPSESNAEKNNNEEFYKNMMATFSSLSGRLENIEKLLAPLASDGSNTP